MEIGTILPDAYKAMAGLEKVIGKSGLPKPLLELVRLRASQINGCAYCVDMHSADAKQGGESDARINAVAVWREAPCFTEQERAALALTEAGTRLSEGGVSDEAWAAAAEVFAEDDLAALVVQIATINAWNRIGVITHMTPESFK
ncbi:carboxymuconolactone decarboxylase family protein [Nonomuraea dietziae]|uniref:AhpD family alkylhydroperoxidase n=1 Tax=Nonomuraea dietziae TaxID=65515 RepID=A0A7W5Y9K8_9ACTN|nr:carboxymuconolactone decarboxylase family protein [Nonomuraea dietziae]MBB3729591.1 AhpD family alkylhydroperoxidase [Nonomuraea dietziae]